MILPNLKPILELHIITYPKKLKLLIHKHSPIAHRQPTHIHILLQVHYIFIGMHDAR